MATYKELKPTVIRQLNGLVEVGHKQSGDLIDFGVVGVYDTATTAKYGGFYRDADDDKMKFFTGLTESPFGSDVVNAAGAGYSLATLEFGTAETSIIKAGNIQTSANQIISTDTNGNISILPDGTGEFLAKADPISALGVATRQYVDAATIGLDSKESVLVATVTGTGLSAVAAGAGVGKTLTNSGGQVPLVLDGVTVNTLNSRILVKDGLGDSEIFTVTFDTAELGGNYDGKYWQFEASGVTYYVWYQESAGSDPNPGGTGILVSALTGGDTPAVIATKTADAINLAIPTIARADNTAAVLTVANVLGGAVTAAASVDLPGTPSFVITQTGTDSSVPDSHNGIYVLTTLGVAPTSSGAGDGINWVLTRSTDCDNSINYTPNLYTFIEQGTVNGDSGWTATTNGTITVDTTAVTFTQFTSPGDTTVSNLGAGAALFKTKIGVDLQFRSIVAAIGSTSTNVIETTENTNDVTITFDQSKITGTGVLTAGSIDTGFGAIDNGASGITSGSINTTSNLLTMSTSALTFGGATGANTVLVPDNLADAFNIKEGSNSYLSATTTNGSESVSVNQNILMNSGVRFNKVTTVFSSQALNRNHLIVEANATGGDIVLSLPLLASNLGRVYYISKEDISANTVTLVVANVSERFDGVENGTLVFTEQYDHAYVIAGSATWYLH